MFLALAVIVISFLVWWFDTPDRNPFVTARVWKLVALGATLIALVMSYKQVQWNRDTRNLILQVQHVCE